MSVNISPTAVPSLFCFETFQYVLVHAPWQFIDSKKIGRLQMNTSLLIIAGSETTATLLSGVTYLLTTNPEALRRLTEEVRSTFQTEKEIDFTSVSSLQYMLACLDEALRMYPPAPLGLPRQTPKGGATIAGHYVPEDVSTASLH